MWYVSTERNRNNILKSCVWKPCPVLQGNRIPNRRSLWRRLEALSLQRNHSRALCPKSTTPLAAWCPEVLHGTSKTSQSILSEKLFTPYSPITDPYPAKKGSRVSKGHVCACERSNSSVAKSLSPFPFSFPRQQNILTPPKTSWKAQTNVTKAIYSNTVCDHFVPFKSGLL